MKYLTIAVLMVASFGLVGNASAGVDAKSYNGSTCSAYYGNQASSFRHRSDGIKNTSSGSRYVACALIQDRVSNHTGADPIWVHWKKGPTSQHISCTFFSKRGNGTTLQSRTETDADGWFRFVPTITQDTRYGTYYMYCNLPKGATLNTIWVDER